MARFFIDVRVSRAGNQIIVVAPDAGSGDRARIEAIALGSPARLDFYDWEANALTPNGKPVASQLHAQAPAALIISQGASSAAPGQPDAGGVALYQAVKLASKQPKSDQPAQRTNGTPVLHVRRARERCLRGKGQAGRDDRRRPVSTACWPAPTTSSTRPAAEQAVKHLASRLPPGVSPSDGQVLIVQQGTVVLQATNPTAGQPIKFPDARFFVLHDNVALSSSDITNPHASTDQAGNPDVQLPASTRPETPRLGTSPIRSPIAART